MRRTVLAAARHRSFEGSQPEFLGYGGTKAMQAMFWLVENWGKRALFALSSG